MRSQYRQGDILFEEVSEKDHMFNQYNEEGIVAYGEISGHKHILSNNAQLYLRTGQQRGMHEGDNRIGYIIAEEGATVTHDEHAMMTLPKGKYKVIQQREFVKPTNELKRYQPPVVKRVQD